MRQEKMVRKAVVPKKKKPRYKIQETWYATHHRCKPEQPYGRRGIKSFLTVEQVRFLWNRDCADRMKHPSIDRIDTTGDYKLNNCRFIELSENRRRRTSGKGKIIQYKNGRFIRIWQSTAIAGDALGISRKAISNCLRKKVKTSGGFGWKRYVENKKCATLTQG